MSAILAALRFLGACPPVPSTTPVYKGTSTTTTDEATSTFTGIDIGVAHCRRIIILAVYHGVAASCTATVNGIPAYFRAQNTAHEVSLHAFQVPNGTLGTVTVTATASLRKAVAVYVAYPKNHAPTDSGTATANTTTNATVTDLKIEAGGFVVFVGAQHATVGAFTTTFSAGSPSAGMSVTEDVDAQLEAVASYTMGRSLSTYGTHPSSDTDDVVLAETVSGTKRLAAASWGPS